MLSWSQDLQARSTACPLDVIRVDYSTVLPFHNGSLNWDGILELEYLMSPGSRKIGNDEV